MEDKVLDMNELVEYIFDELLKDGILVKRKDIRMVLELQTDYLLENGFAEIIEED